MSYDATSKICVGLFEALAKTSEDLNKFAIDLRNLHGLAKTSTGTEIRLFESGWKIQKWVEAILDEEKGLAAAWWLEFSDEGSRWQVFITISITNGDFQRELPILHADTVSEVSQCLEKAVAELIATYGDGEEFRKEIDICKVK